MTHNQSHLATLASKISTSSAMNPGLLFCLIVCPLSLISAVSLFHFEHVVAASIFTAIACFPISIVGWQLVRFTKNDPDRLQRDTHVQRMFQLQHTLGIKEHNTLKEITLAGDLTSNPALEDHSGE
ncbi:MAG: hypothetical protein ABI395_02160 [Sphingobium sp.]